MLVLCPRCGKRRLAEDRTCFGCISLDRAARESARRTREEIRNAERARAKAAEESERRQQKLREAEQEKLAREMRHQERSYRASVPEPEPDSVPEPEPDTAGRQLIDPLVLAFLESALKECDDLVQEIGSLLNESLPDSWQLDDSKVNALIKATGRVTALSRVSGALSGRLSADEVESGQDSPSPALDDALRFKALVDSELA